MGGDQAETSLHHARRTIAPGAGARGLDAGLGRPARVQRLRRGAIGGGTRTGPPRSCPRSLARGRHALTPSPAAGGGRRAPNAPQTRSVEAALIQPVRRLRPQPAARPRTRADRRRAARTGCGAGASPTASAAGPTTVLGVADAGLVRVVEVERMNSGCRSRAPPAGPEPRSARRAARPPRDRPCATASVVGARRGRSHRGHPASHHVQQMAAHAGANPVRNAPRLSTAKAASVRRSSLTARARAAPPAAPAPGPETRRRRRRRGSGDRRRGWRPSAARW